MKKLTLVFTLALVGCGTFQKPESCSGPSFRLNEGFWDGPAVGQIAPAPRASKNHE